jgi:dTDP-4-dehydrorhamnose reductase
VKRLLVTGASGLLGLNLCLQVGERYTVTGSANNQSLRGAPFAFLQADLAEPGAFERLLEQARPDGVVHCAALANIDACEQNPGLSRRLNAELPGEAARACAKRGVRLAHISTDAVFDGVTGQYREEDATNPQSVYARDKLAGEQAVLGEYPGAVVARVNFYGWSLLGQRSLGELFYYNLSAERKMMGFTDVFFCPLLVNDLAEILVEMLEKDLHGLYHVFSSEHQSKYNFGVMLARRFGLDEKLISPVSVKDSGLVARRSPNLIMRTEKLAQALGRPLPGQVEGVSRFYDLHASGYPDRLHRIAQRD